MGRVQPLALLTRPAGRNAPILNGLQRRGWEVLECPVLEIREVLSPVVVVPQPEDFDLVVFVSRAAVSGYRSQLMMSGSLHWPQQTLAACMGPVTAGALRREFGDSLNILHPDAAEAQDSESLWPLLHKIDRPLHKVLIVRGQDGRDWLSQRLREQGVEVTLHQAYSRQMLQWPEKLVKSMTAFSAQQRQGTWLLTSPHGVEAIGRQLEQCGLLGWFGCGAFVLTHERLIPILAKLLSRSVQTLNYVVASPEDAAIIAAFEAFQDQVDEPGQVRST
jgi:uroporphyrinogen-III synthase